MGLDGLGVLCLSERHKTAAHVHVMGVVVGGIQSELPADRWNSGELSILASGVESYTKRLRGALRRVVPGIGSIFMHWRDKFKQANRVRRIWSTDSAGGLRALRSQDWADWGSSQY